MVEIRPVDVRAEKAELTDMEGRIFSVDRFDSWDAYTVFWIILNAEKVGSIAFVPDLMPGLSWEVDKKNPGAIWLVSIGVLPVFQNLGIGAEAIEWGIRWAKLKGFSRIVSNFRVSNKASRRLHEKCGFKSIGIISRYYPDPREEDAELVEIQFAEVRFAE